MWKARERAYPTFSVSQRVSPLRRRPKGFPVALWKPSGPLLRTGLATRNRFLAQGKEPSIFFPHHRRFRLCGGDQGAFRSPPGPLRGPVFRAGGRNLPQTAVSLWQARKMPFLLFPACTKPFLKYNKKSPVRLTAPGFSPAMAQQRLRGHAGKANDKDNGQHSRQGADFLHLAGAQLQQGVGD